jgi:hypothetical protein
MYALAVKRSGGRDKPNPQGLEPMSVNARSRRRVLRGSRVKDLTPGFSGLGSTKVQSRADLGQYGPTFARDKLP